MYARQLADILHQVLGVSEKFDETLQRFQALRGYGLLPAGRENASVRLTDKQISSAVLGFVPTLPAWAGHISLALGGLCAVGGPSASIHGTKTLLETIALIIANNEACESLDSFTFSVACAQNDDEYFAKAIWNDTGIKKTVSYVSRMAISLLSEGANKNYDHNRTDILSARQLVLSHEIFRRLRRDVDTSRCLNLPFKTDWREYENEEQWDAFHRKLGARGNSCFLNIGVDTQVTWPDEPTRAEFGGRHFVLFPKTKDNSQSISIDLANERISANEARTLLNRFLSMLSWCDDRHAMLKSGWSGNPIPVPISRHEEVISTTSRWVFSRSISENDQLLQRLAYYREGLNARYAGLITFAVLSFYKVFERRERSKKGVPNPTKQWIAIAYSDAVQLLHPEDIVRFDADREGITVENYLYEKCRVAIAHTSEASPSDADASPELQRLHSAAKVIHALARHFIRVEYGLSKSYFSDQVSPYNKTGGRS